MCFIYLKRNVRRARSARCDFQFFPEKFEPSIYYFMSAYQKKLLPVGMCFKHTKCNQNFQWNELCAASALAVLNHASKALNLHWLKEIPKLIGEQCGTFIKHVFIHADHWVMYKLQWAHFKNGCFLCFLLP